MGTGSGIGNYGSGQRCPAQECRKDGKHKHRIFIGHGRSKAWKQLRRFIRSLGLVPDEFNEDPVAELRTKERLRAMLDNACFAFLVMTADDQHVDGTHHARENVIREAGLFQERLGFQRAIILLEQGCAEFSNIEGIQQIRFPRGNTLATAVEIHGVLEREGIPTRGGENRA
ncbi:MAG: nucleotide-binding protein [Planctomycetes bacterium]|nr:nucleotide-binding protein [Planctomycetota bacterium]